MATDYKSGTYCNDINCERMSLLQGLSEDEYFTEKNRICNDCAAWNFYKWLLSKNYTIGKKPGKPVSAPQAQWMDYLSADNLTEDELITLRTMFA